MSTIQTLRGLINQRLSAAAEEIFELFERTIAEYEEQLCRSKEDQHKHLDPVYNPEVRLHGADTLKLLVSTEEVPPDQQERNPSLDQEDPPEPPHIKEEQEELWRSQEREQLQGLEEADNREVILTPVPVKNGEDDEEEPQSSQLHEQQTEENGDSECLETEPAGEDRVESEPDNHLQPVTDEETSHSESETCGRSCDLGEVSDVQLSLNPLQNKEVPVSDEKYNTRKRSVTSSECAGGSGQKNQEQKGNRIQRDERQFSCSVCGKRFCKNKYLLAHKACHTKSNRYKCTVCKKFFLVRLDLERHMRSHTGEKPYSCSVCGKSFTQKSNLFRHQKIHTREKPFSCSLCDASFRQKTHLARHTRTHTGERPFSCSVCRKTFSERGTLQRHLTVHTKQKQFICKVCYKRFTRMFSLVRHKCKRVALS